jgi:hypothetical protein
MAQGEAWELLDRHRVLYAGETGNSLHQPWPPTEGFRAWEPSSATLIVLPPEPEEKEPGSQDEAAENVAQVRLPFWVSVSRKKKIRRIHRAGGCSVRWDCKWWEDAETMESANANAICRKCWPIPEEKTKEEIDAEATSSSSSDSEEVVFEAPSVPLHPPGQWDWDAALPLASAESRA